MNETTFRNRRVVRLDNPEVPVDLLTTFQR